MRRLLCLPMPYGASKMFVSCEIRSFYVLLRKYIFDFPERIHTNTNSLIEAYLPNAKRKYFLSIILTIKYFAMFFFIVFF